MIAAHYSSDPRARKYPIHSIASYDHETLRIGGYRSANLTFNCNRIDLEDWFFNGVGRHFEAHSSRGNKVWEGLVNIVSLNVGPRSIKIGPLLKVSNNIRVGWQYPNYGVVNDPNAGVYEETDWEDNLTSQERFGVLDEFISAGSSEQEPAYALRDNLLINLSEPKLSESLSTEPSTSSISISLSCIGYSRMLEKQVYNREWVEGLSYIDLMQKLINMLNENRFFVNERSLTRILQEVDISVPPEDEKNRTVWGIMTDDIAKSLAADNVIFGMFDDMAIVLNDGSDWNSYQRELGSPYILDRNRSAVENSEVIPGGTMMMSDFSRPIEYSITSVKYSLASDSVSINFHDSSLRTLLSGTMLGGMHS